MWAIIQHVDNQDACFTQLSCCTCRSALRAAAEELNSVGFAKWTPNNITDPSSLQKQCEFMLDLTVTEIPSTKADVERSAWTQLTQSQSDEVQAPDAMVNGTLWSSNCNITVEINATTTHLWVYEAKAVNYSFMVTALTFLQVGHSLELAPQSAHSGTL